MSDADANRLREIAAAFVPIPGDEGKANKAIADLRAIAERLDCATFIGFGQRMQVKATQLEHCSHSACSMTEQFCEEYAARVLRELLEQVVAQCVA